MRGARAFIAIALIGCTAPPPAVRCEPFTALAAERLSLEVAREAHQWAELRRELRFARAAQPRYVLDRLASRVSQEAIDAGGVSCAELYSAGRLLFEHEYVDAEGLGTGEGYRRVQSAAGGPETHSCTSCHWRGGLAGAGSLLDNALLMGDGRTVSSADARNPPALAGVGLVQALAQEMSADLAATRLEAVRRARAAGADVELELTSKGLAFGVVRASARGELDVSGVWGVDADLVVKPFGWKGTFATLREFISESLHTHLGIDTASRQAAVGPDEDDVGTELTDGQLTALVVFLAALEIPTVRTPRSAHEVGPAAPGLRPPADIDLVPQWQRGRELFAQVGCSECHVPQLILTDPVLRTAPALSGVSVEIDLAQQGELPRPTRDPAVGGYPVNLFSDLRRHDLGEEVATRHIDRGVPRRQFITRPLWGLGKTEPYLHDGRAVTVDDAIAAHGGEASEARAAFNALDEHARGALRVYLVSLQREFRPLVP